MVNVTDIIKRLEAHRQYLINNKPAFGVVPTLNLGAISQSVQGNSQYIELNPYDFSLIKDGIKYLQIIEENPGGITSDDINLISLLEVKILDRFMELSSKDSMTTAELNNVYNLLVEGMARIHHQYKDKEIFVK